ncbi:MAG: glutaredoxin domain-containing protein [Myxococcota bacterium]
MARPILAELHPAIADAVGRHYDAYLDEVMAAVAEHDVVVVGMAVNPFPKRARRLLDAENIPHRYLEYGSYLSGWRARTTLKMWTGWPTFPMVFVKGQLVGGFAELERLVQSGELQSTLSSS